MTLVAEALGATRIPSACRARQVPTVRRSCQPMPGASGVPVARSQTMLEARWLATPTPATGPPSASAARATSSAASAMRGRVELDQPGSGRVGQHGEPVLVLDGGVGTDDGGADARGADVDDEDAAARCAHCQGDGPNGEARPNLPGLRMPVGIEGRLQPCEDVEPGAEGARQEARAVQPDAVVVADGGTVRQCRIGDHVPGLAVVALPPCRRRPRARARRR